MSEPGLPVEIGRIDRELGRLWESSDDTKTRASLINLVIYSEEPDALDSNTELISTIASQHAFRAILILANPDATASAARAWISAHCHLADKGGRQICSEQITFQLDGESAASLPNIVFSHLDSDLPLCFWSQAEFREPLDEGLWSWVDRLIFDSAKWKCPAEQFALCRKIQSFADGGTVLCDLNWTRLHRWRFALASIFDHSAALACLPGISTVRIRCARGERTAGILLLGWLSSQLGWSLRQRRSYQTHGLRGKITRRAGTSRPTNGAGRVGPLDRPHTATDSTRSNVNRVSDNFFLTAEGGRVAFEILETESSGLSSVELAGAGFCFGLRRAEGSEFFHADLHAPGIPDCSMTIGAGHDRPSDTLLAELSRGGRHPLFAKALDAISPLIRAATG